MNEVWPPKPARPPERGDAGQLIGNLDAQNATEHCEQVERRVTPCGIAMQSEVGESTEQHAQVQSPKEANALVAS
jgi:hypothetical protein